MPAELHDVPEPYIHQLDRPGLDLRHRHHDDHHHDDGHGHAHDDPFGRDPSVPTGPAPIADPFEPNNRPPAYEPVRRAESENVWVFAASLIGKSNEQIRGEVLRYVASTTPEERSRLIEQLGLAIPNLVQIIAPSGSPEAGPVTPAPAERPSNVAAERDRLLAEITSVYSDFRNAQEAMAEEVIVSLAGVPDQVVLGVLRDWRADLLSIDRSADPDTGTSINTPLDVRIVRQLAAARVPLSSLDTSLQTRLRRVERQ